MADLIKKFFQSELTETEDRALANQLVSSEKAADRFAETAEKAYFALGLPEPRVMGRWARLWRSAWGKYLPVIAVLGGVATYLWLARLEKPLVPRVPAVPPVPQRVVPSPSIKQLVRPAIPPSKLPKPIGTPPTPADMVEAPPNQSFATDYRNLRVVVNQESNGIVKIRILGPDGAEVRRLFDGPLDAGQWVFNWDGISSNGKPAPPGIYRIEIESGAGTKSQEVLIRGK